jgi:hypothetical protein
LPHEPDENYYPAGSIRYVSGNQVMKKSLIYNTFWLFAAAFAILLKSSLAGAQVHVTPQHLATVGALATSQS